MTTYAAKSFEDTDSITAEEPTVVPEQRYADPREPETLTATLVPPKTDSRWMLVVSAVLAVFGLGSLFLALLIFGVVVYLY